MKYEVTVEETKISTHYLTVNASSEEEARKIAKEYDVDAPDPNVLRCQTGIGAAGIEIIEIRPTE